MADAFDNLNSVLSQQFFGQDKLGALDLSTKGTANTSYGSLGEFASKFDQSAERHYTEEGSFQTDIFNPQIKNVEMLMQEPNITVLIKKRAFSSLAENYRLDLTNKNDTLFIKATKILFQNKCKQIAAFEKLTKIEKIATEMGRVDYNLLPLIFGATDTLNTISPQLQQSLSGFTSTINKVREIITFNYPSIYTSWMVNLDSIYKTDFGEGTGVIELTNVDSVNTTVSINFGGGSCNFSMTDPYDLMRITDIDIDQAIADATNAAYNSSFYQLGIKTLTDSIQRNINSLNKTRNIRGAQKINFIINTSSTFNKAVMAVVDVVGQEIIFNNAFTSKTSGKVNDILGIGNEVAIAQGISSNGLTIDASAKQGSDLLGQNGLSNDEASIFSLIVSEYYNLIQLQQSSQTQIKNFNRDEVVVYIRKKMRLHYGSKFIIQPMDVVHIFIDGKSQLDTRVTGGLHSAFDANGFLQASNNIMHDISDSFNILNNSSIEKAVLVGNDFPSWLWLLMRNQIVNDKSGTHVFAGVVNSVTSNFSGGFFNISVSCGDNTEYFKFGVINFQPSADVFNDSLFDPLTPFDIKFDRTYGLQENDVPDLLPENKEIFKSAFLKYKNGLYMGRKPTEENFLQDADRTNNNSMRRVFYDPDGLVYKWKEGIGSLTLFGSSYSDRPINNSYSPALTSDPFAGQDIMNTLSLLITGEPYNYATFYQAATKFDNFARDPSSGKDPSISYFRGLQKDLKYRNLIYGNFIPFKKLSVDEASYTTMVFKQINAQIADQNIGDLLQQRAQLEDQLLVQFGNNTTTNTTQTSKQQDVTDATRSALLDKISSIDAQIKTKQTDITNSLDLNNSTPGAKKPFSFIGNDISLDYHSFMTIEDKNRMNPSVRDELRRKVNFLTRRFAWKVRTNEDVNLFIVDDSYDKDMDIQAFEVAFKNPELFRSNYENVEGQITRVAGIIPDLEYFADTQGHIQIRQPQYNRIPSSVLYRMLRLEQEFGIQLFPQFLKDLFVNQLNSVFDQVSVIEDEIRLYCIVLGQTDDASIQNFINNSQATKGLGDVKFKFISDSNGNISVGGQPLNNLLLMSQPDQQMAGISQKLEILQTQTHIHQLFNIFDRTPISQKSSFKILTSSDGAMSVFTEISQRIYQRTGQQFDINQIIPQSVKLGKSPINVNQLSGVDLLKILNDLASRISERQKLIKIAFNALKNVQEGVSLAENANREGNKLLYPYLFGNKDIPETLQYLIEDESYDDYGPGAGKRYVIKNYNIISFTYTEEPPKYNAVQVDGNFDLYIPNDQLQGFDAFQGGGNGLSSALAIDYDLWRMYGIRLPQTIKAPYLSDPDSQCAPFAVALLNKARKNIFKASAVLAGNEYYQPGDVVYIENIDMLFYVESISHAFSYGGNFTTNLSLSYGHKPGEYIPTVFDILGKILYKNKNITNFVHNRQGSSYSEESLGVVIGNTSITNPNALKTNQDTSSVMDDIVSFNTEYKSNRSVITNVLNSAPPTLSSSSTSTDVFLELRIYYNSGNSSFSKPSNYSTEVANALKKILIGTGYIDETSFTSLGQQNTLSFMNSFSDKIKIVAVDTNSKKNTINSGTADASSDFRRPSKDAYAMARKIVAKTKTVDQTSSNDIDKIIYNYIVDCVIYYKNIDNPKTPGST